MKANFNKNFAWFLQLVVFSSLILLTIFSTKAYQYRSLRAALASIRGREVIIVPDVIDIGDVESGDLIEVTFKIKNISRNHINILGNYVSCSCTNINNRFPTTLPPGETLDLVLAVKIPVESNVNLSEEAILYTDSIHTRSVGVRIVGRVKGMGTVPEDKRDSAMATPITESYSDHRDYPGVATDIRGSG